MRERYGRTTFGQSCLAARRLVERGVPYVTINYKGWDTHKQHFQVMRQRLPQLDKGFARCCRISRSTACSTARSSLGWGGEFGRTPRVQWEPPWNGGRGHWGSAFSTVLAGGGFRGGHLVARRTRTAKRLKDRPVSPADVVASIFTQMGFSTRGEAAQPRRARHPPRAGGRRA